MTNRYLAAFAFAALGFWGAAGAAEAYEFDLTYRYGGSVFAFDPSGTFRSAPVSESGQIRFTSAQARPDVLGFDDDNIRLTLANGTYVLAAHFPALGGTGYANALVDASEPLGDFGFGAFGYGSDDMGQFFSGSISGTFSVEAVTAVPLPDAALLFGTALAALGAIGAGARRRGPAIRAA